MDGARVGVVLDMPGKECDAVHFWNVPWHSFVRINMRRDVTCTEGLSIGNRIAMAGIAVQWIATKARTSQVIVSDGDKCIEHKAGLLRMSAPPLAGDGLLVAFGGLRSSSGSGAQVMNWKEHTHVELRSPVRARLLSADQSRVALHREDGKTDVFTSTGELLARLATTPARAMALRGNRLILLSRLRLEVWSVTAGKRIQSWGVPQGTRPEIDLHHGIAVFVTGRAVHAVDVASGRRSVLARTPSHPRAQIETAGVAYQYNERGRGALRFIGLAAVESSVGRG